MIELLMIVLIRLLMLKQVSDMFQNLLKCFFSTIFYSAVDSIEVFGNDYSITSFEELQLSIFLIQRQAYYELIKNVSDFRLKNKVRFQIFEIKSAIFKCQRKREDYLSSLVKSL